MADSFFTTYIFAGDYPQFSSRDILNLANPNIKKLREKPSLSLKGFKRDKKAVRDYYHKLIDEVFSDEKK